MSQMPSRATLPIALPLKRSNWANAYGTFDHKTMAIIKQKLSERPHIFKNGDFHPVFLPCEQSDEYDEAAYVPMSTEERASIADHVIGLQTVHDSISVIFRAPPLALDRGASPEAE